MISLVKFSFFSAENHSSSFEVSKIAGCVKASCLVRVWKPESEKTSEKNKSCKRPPHTPVKANYPHTPYELCVNYSGSDPISTNFQRASTVFQAVLTENLDLPSSVDSNISIRGLVQFSAREHCFFRTLPTENLYLTPSRFSLWIHWKISIPGRATAKDVSALAQIKLQPAPFENPITKRIYKIHRHHRGVSKNHSQSDREHPIHTARPTRADRPSLAMCGA